MFLLAWQGVDSPAHGQLRCHRRFPKGHGTNRHSSLRSPGQTHFFLFMAISFSAPCPCGRQMPASATARKSRTILGYAACCGRYLDHWDALPAPDAESLMRSRYTAFVMERANYLQATWHQRTCPAVIDFDAATKWLGLEVRSHRITGQDDACVEFVARYRIGGRAVRLHETSRFLREGGRWLYVDGDLHER